MKKKRSDRTPGRPKTKDPRVHRVVVVYNNAEKKRFDELSKGYASPSEYVRERTLG